MPVVMMVGKTFINSKLTLPILVALLFGVAEVGGDGVVAPLLLSSDWGEWLVRPWSLVSYGVVHTGGLHVGVNLLLLSWLALSRCIGVREYWGLFLSGVVIGGIIFFIGGDGVLMGASSGIAAIVPVEIYRRFGKKWGGILLVLWIAIFEFIAKNSIGGVVQSIHLGGYLIGLLYLLSSWKRLSTKDVEHKEIIEKANLSGYQSLNRAEREEIRQMGV